MFNAAGGTYLLSSGELDMTMSGSTIGFDWSVAHPVLFRIAALAERIKDWWRDEDADGKSTGWLGARPRARRRARATSERRPHSQRAYGLSTFAFAAIAKENRRSTASDDETRDPTTHFIGEIKLLESQVSAAEESFELAAQ